jgi:predicted RNA binding protein YcfA (HicA-like mRNA interferase family)
MNPISGKRMCKVLEAHGGHFERIRGSHHLYSNPITGRSLPVPVHGNHDMKPGTQRSVMR